MTAQEPQISNRMPLKDIKELIEVLPTASIKDLAEVPLWLLLDMEIVAAYDNNPKALQTIQEEIQRNLAQQQRARKAEQLADEMENIARQAKALEQSILSRLALKQAKSSNS